MKLLEKMPKVPKLPKMPKVNVFNLFYKKKKARYAIILICWLLIFHAENTRRL